MYYIKNIVVFKKVVKNFLYIKFIEFFMGFMNCFGVCVLVI